VMHTARYADGVGYEQKTQFQFEIPISPSRSVGTPVRPSFCFIVYFFFSFVCFHLNYTAYTCF
jgi:hypothetical protein